MKVESEEALVEAKRFIAATLSAILLLGSVFALRLGRSITAPLELARTWARTT